MAQPDPETLHLYVIHTQALTTRQGRLHGTIQSIRQLAQALGMNFKSILVLKPDPVDLVPNLANLNARVTYESVNEPAFDATRHVLNIEEISNLEKHREAWRRMQTTPVTDKFMIIEDDNMLPSDNISHLAAILKQPVGTWDYLDMNMTSTTQDPASPNLVLEPIYAHTKVLVSKQAYMITPAAAKAMLRETETIRFTARGHISYAIHMLKNSELAKSYFPSKRIMLEGSKVGVYPSSLHGSNHLIYNAEYMQLWNMLQEVTAGKTIDEANVRAVFKSIEHVGNADMHHIYGKILRALGYPKQAFAIWEKAIEHLQKNQGMLNQNTDLLNDIINIHQDLQTEEVAEYMKTPSKYAIKTSS